MWVVSVPYNLSSSFSCRGCSGKSWQMGPKHELWITLLSVANEGSMLLLPPVLATPPPAVATLLPALAPPPPALALLPPAPALVPPALAPALLAVGGFSS